MAALLAGAAWACLIGWLIARAVRQSRVHRAVSLRRPDPAGLARAVALIVPARNEAENIGRCLAGLSAQRDLPAGSSITVVDDGSQDATAELVRRSVSADPRVSLREAGVLPAGWLGKPHACWRGANSVAADWLCFIDADVSAAPELLAAAVATAERDCIDMLSLTPFQELGSFWERLIVPAGLVLIACAKDLRRVDDPASAEIFANGQFILIRRAVYFAVGGHAAVRGEVCEDKALAARVKAAGYRFRLRGAEHLARTRMYRDLPSLWEGFSKNATEIMGDGVNTLGAASLALAIGWAALLLPLLTVCIAIEQPWLAPILGAAFALLGTFAVLGIQIGTARHFRLPAAYGLLFPFAYTAVAALAWHSVGLRREGRVTWKGRTYEIHRKA
ncbi:MAG TPA: glycosyltransferase [Stellaceae bacterium]